MDLSNAESTTAVKATGPKGIGPAGGGRRDVGPVGVRVAECRTLWFVRARVFFVPLSSRVSGLGVLAAPQTLESNKHNLNIDI